MATCVFPFCLVQLARYSVSRSCPLRTLMTVDARSLSRRDGPLDGHAAWVAAFEQAGTTLRRPARDYATRPHRSEAVIHVAMTDLMTRRLTGENTISWRDPTPAHQSRIQG